MKQNTDSWDMIILYNLVQKLDNKTKKKEWELHIIVNVGIDGKSLIFISFN